VRAIAAAALALGIAAAGPAQRADASPAPCSHPILILSAMPLELNPLVARAKLDLARAVRIDDRTFYPGRLAGRDVVLALTGIGPANATQTAQTAVAHFGCRFSAVLFSGVAGSRLNIGDVAVPRRWTSDGRKTWTSADAGMLAAARPLAGTRVPLSRDVPVGDAACLCSGVDAPTPAHVDQTPKVVVGGDGETTDPFGGKAVPCLPGGGDIEGCAPCLLPSAAPADAAAFADHAPSLADPRFAQALFQPPAEDTAAVDASDEETAAVAQVARAHHVPFLGIRAVSDGAGDPLGLPGFPSQFVVYRQLAANNGAAVTIAFLGRWAPPTRRAARRPRASGPARPHRARRASRQPARSPARSGAARSSGGSSPRARPTR